MAAQRIRDEMSGSVGAACPALRISWMSTRLGSSCPRSPSSRSQKPHDDREVVLQLVELRWFVIFDRRHRQSVKARLEPRDECRSTCVIFEMD